MGARWATHQSHSADVRSRLNQLKQLVRQGFACVEARLRLRRLCVRIADHARLRLRRARLREESTAFVTPKTRSIYQVSTSIYQHRKSQVSTTKNTAKHRYLPHIYYPKLEVSTRYLPVSTRVITSAPSSSSSSSSSSLSPSSSSSPS